MICLPLVPTGGTKRQHFILFVFLPCPRSLLSSSINLQQTPFTKVILCCRLVPSIFKMPEQGAASNKTSGTGIMHNLVACGATEPDAEADGVMFSDFMGISHHRSCCLSPRQRLPSCPVSYSKEHFDFLSKRTAPHHTHPVGSSRF